MLRVEEEEKKKEVVVEEDEEEEVEVEVEEDADGWYWDAHTNFRHESLWYKSVEDEQLRDKCKKYLKHCLDTQGFDIDLEAPPFPHYDFLSLKLDDEFRGRSIRRAARMAVQRFNTKKRRELVLVEILKANCSISSNRYYITLRALDKSTSKIRTYQTRVFLCEPFVGLPIKDEDDVETFRPLPDCQDSEQQCYAACSRCEKLLYELLTEHARKAKVETFLPTGVVGLDHPFHRCRIKQCANAAFEHHYNQKQSRKLFVSEVLEAEVSHGESNQLHYHIKFRAVEPGSDLCNSTLESRLVYDNSQHGEDIKVDSATVIEREGPILLPI